MSVEFHRGSPGKKGEDGALEHAVLWGPFPRAEHREHSAAHRGRGLGAGCAGLEN